MLYHKDLSWPKSYCSVKDGVAKDKYFGQKGFKINYLSVDKIAHNLTIYALYVQSQYYHGIQAHLNRSSRY